MSPSSEEPPVAAQDAAVAILVPLLLWATSSSGLGPHYLQVYCLTVLMVLGTVQYLVLQLVYFKCGFETNSLVIVNISLGTLDMDSQDMEFNSSLTSQEMA